MNVRSTNAALVVLALVVTLLPAAGSAQQAPPGDGSTPLHWAAYRDDIASVDKLLASGADVNAATDLGVTPLWVACVNGSAPMVRRLLTAGARPNMPLVAGETPLMAAARSGNPDVVRMLLETAARTDARGTRSQTALMWAAAQRHSAVVKELVSHGADIQARSDQWSSMVAVPPHGYRNNNRLMKQGSDTALLFAARNGDLESARILLDAGANVNDADAEGISATMFAAHSGYTEIVALLLARGANPNTDQAGFTALHVAVMRGNEKMVQALLEKGADTTALVRVWTPTRRSSDDLYFHPALVGATPFWLAARFGSANIMRMLVQHGADPSFVHTSTYATDAVGNTYTPKQEKTTAVMAAAGMGGGVPWVELTRPERERLALDAIKVGLELGIDVNAASIDGRTALDAARTSKYETVVQFLQSQGARGRPGN